MDRDDISRPLEQLVVFINSPPPSAAIMATSGSFLNHRLVLVSGPLTSFTDIALSSATFEGIRVGYQGRRGGEGNVRPFRSKDHRWNRVVKSARLNLSS